MKPLKMVSIVLLSLLSLTAGCGKNTESYSTDVSDELSSGGIEEVADSISDGSTGQTTSMLNTALTSVNPLTNDFTLTRACTASGGVATVNVTFSGSKSLSLSGPNFTIANEVTVSGTRQRVWTPPAGQTVECTVNGYFASIPWTNDTVMNGLSLTDTFNRTRNVTRTFTKKADNTTNRDSHDCLVNRLKWFRYYNQDIEYHIERYTDKILHKSRWYKRRYFDERLYKVRCPNCCRRGPQQHQLCLDYQNYQIRNNGRSQERRGPRRNSI
jgi:hypothetical protein